MKQINPKNMKMSGTIQIEYETFFCMGCMQEKRKYFQSWKNNKPTGLCLACYQRYRGKYET